MPPQELSTLSTVTSLAAQEIEQKNIHDIKYAIVCAWLHGGSCIRLER